MLFPAESPPVPGPPGVVTVGYASVAGDAGGGEDAAAAANAAAVLFGVTLTLLGQVVQAAQAPAKREDFPVPPGKHTKKAMENPPFLMGESTIIWPFRR